MITPSPKPAPRVRKSKKSIAHRSDSLEKEVDEIWSQCIKLRALFKSELSGVSGVIQNDRVEFLNSHHIAKKPNYHLRYSLDNGFCLLESEHEEFHFEATGKEFERRSIKLVGQERWDRLSLLKNDTLKPVLVYIKEDLLKKRQELIERAMKMADSNLLKVFLKQIGVAQ